MKLWLKNHWPYFLIGFLTILFWYPALMHGSFFYDDWDFIRTFQEGKASLGYFFAPHNEHFMPLFKGIFFILFNIFGLNVTPYMGLLILVHIMNAALFYQLCGLLFPDRKWLPLLLSVIFLSNSAYFEVLHWFILLSTAGSLLFLQITLIEIHLYAIRGEKKHLWISVATSFFIPMNFSLGLIGIVFIFLYYRFILRNQIRPTALIPYVLTWMGFLVLYAIFVIPHTIAGKGGGISLHIAQGLENTVLGFLGYATKSLGISILMPPINMWIAGFLMVNIFFVGLFLVFYFVLNHRRSRIQLFESRGIALFSLMGAAISYAAIAFARTDLGADAFLNWGRYQFFPVFFLTIFLGAFLPNLMEIFSRVFDRGRLKNYLSILLIVYLIGHFVLIRTKAESPIRLEGNLISPNISLLSGRSTSEDTSVTIWPA